MTPGEAAWLSHFPEPKWHDTSNPKTKSQRNIPKKRGTSVIPAAPDVARDLEEIPGMAPAALARVGDMTTLDELIVAAVERGLSPTSSAPAARLPRRRERGRDAFADVSFGRAARTRLAGGGGVSAIPSPAERLANPERYSSRTDLRELGLERRAVDAVFRALDVIVLPATRDHSFACAITSCSSSAALTTTGACASPFERLNRPRPIVVLVQIGDAVLARDVETTAELRVLVEQAPQADQGDPRMLRTSTSSGSGASSKSTVNPSRSATSASRDRSNEPEAPCPTPPPPSSHASSPPHSCA